MQSSKSKISGKGIGIVSAVATFVIMIFLSYFGVKNYSKLYEDKQYADIITSSESLGTQVYNAVMRSFSRAIPIAELVSNQGLGIANAHGQLRGIISDTDIKGILFTKEGEIVSVFPQETMSNYLGLDFTINFPEVIKPSSLHNIDGALILGPYIKPGSQDQAMAVLSPYYSSGPGGRKVEGVVAVIADYPDIFRNVDTSAVDKRNILYRIWRYNEHTSQIQTLLESEDPFPAFNSRNNTTFKKLYFTTAFNYSLVPKYNFYSTRDFYILLVSLALLSIILSAASYYIVNGISQANDLKVYKVQSKLVKIQEHTIISLSSLVENRDSDTGEHIRRTSDYVYLIGTEARNAGLFPEILTDDYLEMLRNAAPMHDIGKIVVPDAILKKPGKLTPEEFNQIKCHTVEGGKIIMDIIGPVQSKEFVRITKEIAESHHEKWDGSGYPYGLKDNNIPLSARIMALADVFDALTSARCYKDPFSFDKAIDIISEGRGSHFDPQLTDIFITNKDKIQEIMNSYLNKQA